MLWRWKADAGFARSTFTNVGANDPQLTQGAAIVALQPVTKNAWYVETSFDVLKDVKLDPTFRTSIFTTKPNERNYILNGYIIVNSRKMNTKIL